MWVAVYNVNITTLNAELNSICHFLALLGAHHILHVSSLSAKSHLPSADIISISPYYTLYQGKS